MHKFSDYHTTSYLENIQYCLVNPAIFYYNTIYWCEPEQVVGYRRECVPSTNLQACANVRKNRNTKCYRNNLLHAEIKGRLSWQKSFFFVFLVKMNVWMVWNLYIFWYFFWDTNTQLYSLLYSLFLKELFHFRYRRGMPWCHKGTAAQWSPTESIVKQRVGIGCSASSIVQTGDPGHCSECN